MCLGTGKSMTGAHIAYALAVKLKRELRQHSAENKDNLNPCVMYCGPSQQSVNVVLGEAHCILIIMLYINALM